MTEGTRRVNSYLAGDHAGLDEAGDLRAERREQHLKIKLNSKSAVNSIDLGLDNRSSDRVGKVLET